MVRYFSHDAATKFSLVLTIVDLFGLVLLMFADKYVFCFISNMRLFQLLHLHELALSLWATYALFIVSLSDRESPFVLLPPLFSLSSTRPSLLLDICSGFFCSGFTFFPLYNMFPYKIISPYCHSELNEIKLYFI